MAGAGLGLRRHAATKLTSRLHAWVRDSGIYPGEVRWEASENSTVYLDGPGAQHRAQSRAGSIGTAFHIALHLFACTDTSQRTSAGLCERNRWVGMSNGSSSYGESFFQWWHCTEPPSSYCSPNISVESLRGPLDRMAQEPPHGWWTALREV